MPPRQKNPAAAATTPKKGRPVKVRALALGYYDHVRRREGDVFVYALGENEKALPKWVEAVSEDTPTRVTPAQSALNRQMPGGEDAEL